MRGAKYMLTFIDDYSRRRWIYSMCFKCSNSTKHVKVMVGTKWENVKIKVKVKVGECQSHGWHHFSR